VKLSANDCDWMMTPSNCVTRYSANADGLIIGTSRTDYFAWVSYLILVLLSLAVSSAASQVNDTDSSSCYRNWIQYIKDKIRNLGLLNRLGFGMKKSIMSCRQKITLSIYNCFSLILVYCVFLHCVCLATCIV